MGRRCTRYRGSIAVKQPCLALCTLCKNSEIQMDLFSTGFEKVTGCTELSDKEWEKGWKDGTQTNCPLFKSQPKELYIPTFEI